MIGAPTPVAVTVCICTYRREHVATTLNSLASLRLEPGTSVRVVVADNDREPSARERVSTAAANIPFPVTYLHAPADNISIARNACLDEASGDYLAFLDDDEIATPDWLVELLAAARETEAEVVLGPVHAIYADAAPDWMASGNFHSTFPEPVRGIIRTGYTCNVLMRLGAVRDLRLRFEIARGKTGGEDTAFFSDFHAAGGRIAYAPGALVSEVVPAGRARFAWLSARRFRMGQTHGSLLDTGTAGGRIGHVALAGAKATCLLVASAAMLHRPVTWRRNLLRATLHLGVVSVLLGGRSAAQYGDGRAREGSLDAA